MPKPVLVHVLNIFRPAAIPHIIRDLHNVVSKYYDVHIVALQSKMTDVSLVAEFESLAVEVHALNCGRSNLPLAAIRLKSMLKALKPDIVHSHMGRASMLSVLCKSEGAALIVTHHNVVKEFDRATAFFLRFTDRLLVNRTFVSKAVQDSWRQQGVRPGPTIYNPVDSNRFEGKNDCENIRKELQITEPVSLIVNVGRLVDAKGQEVLLDAMYRLKRLTNRQFLLVIAGWGPCREKLAQKIDALGLEENVKLLGVRSDIPALLTAADVFAFPSRWEGFSVATLEAMAAETAVVASDLPMLRESIDDGNTGILVPPDDACAMAEEIARIISDDSLRRSIASAARRHVQTAFAPDRIARQYVELYQNATDFI